MKFGRTIIKNFSSVEKAEFDLQDKGLIAIQGSNLDNTSAKSNGSGKSSLASGIGWGIYGETPNSIGASDVIRVGEKETMVEIELIDENTDDKYTITRIRNKNSISLDLICEKSDGTSVNLTGGTVADTQAKIDNIIGCSYTTFMSGIYLAQEKMPNIPAMTDKSLKLLIEEAAGISILEAAYGTARDAAKKIEGNLLSLKTALKYKEENLKTLQSNLDSFNSREADFKVTQLSNLGIAKAKRDEFVDGMEKAKKRAEEVNLKELVEQEKALERNISNAQTINAVIYGLKSKVSDLKNNISDSEVQINHLESVKEKIKKDITKIENGETTKCPTCGSEINSEEAKRHAVDHQNKKLTSTNNNINLIQADISANKIKLDDLLRELAVKKEVDVSAEMEKLKEIREKTNSATAIKMAIQAYKNYITIAEADIKKIENEKSPYKELIEKYTKQYKEAEKEIAEVTKDVAKLEADLELANKIVKVFSPSGVRSHIMDTVTPFLNRRTEYYLNHLSDHTLKAEWHTTSTNSKGELKENFHIKVSSGITDNFNALSGGEKRKVRVSCALALQDLISGRAVKPINLFIADEIDDALDGAGLERLMGILEEKAKEKGTVLIISHNDIASYAPNTWTMVKQSGKSNLKL